MADMTLEEALEAATVDEELISPVNEVLMINPETRTINVPDSEKLFGARQDMNVERKYFKCPRIVGDNIDLSQHRIFVNYVPSKQDGTYNLEDDVQGYWCKDLAVEGDFITFSWELTENVLRKAGYIAFAVYAKVSDENGNLKTKWHTTIAIGNVLDTLPDGEEWITIYPDIVTQLLERMDAVEKIANPESMQEYVDDYFNRNPMMIDRELKDSTKAAPADIVGKLSEEKIDGIGIKCLVALTQAEYDALEEKDATTLYIITDATSEDNGSGDDEGGEDTPTNMIPYLKSDGVAYVKLSHGHIDGATYEMCFRAENDFENNDKMFGNRYTNIGFAGGVKTESYIIGYYNGSSYAKFGGGTIDISKKRIYTITDTALILDNDVVTEITAGTTTKYAIMYLFAVNNSDQNNGEYLAGKSALTFFYLRITDADGNLLYHYKPAEDSEGVACIYEAVNKTYLYNAEESGGFVYGTELEES